MSEPICKNCARFKYSGHGQYGTCMLPFEIKGMVAGSSCGLRVNENFGCNQFKEKRKPGIDKFTIEQLEKVVEYIPMPEAVKNELDRANKEAVEEFNKKLNEALDKEDTT